MNYTAAFHHDGNSALRVKMVVAWDSASYI